MIPGKEPTPLGQGPLGSGTAQVIQHPLGRLTQLGPGGREPNVSWEAYPLSVAKPGQPHILEVDYPSDVIQTLGISILEPNAAGAIAPVGLDSGCYTSQQQPGDAPHWAKHRIYFWPRTAAPVVLLTNRREGSRPCTARSGSMRDRAGCRGVSRDR